MRVDEAVAPTIIDSSKFTDIADEKVKEANVEELGYNIANNIVSEEDKAWLGEQLEEVSKLDDKFDLDGALQSYDPEFTSYRPHITAEAVEFFNLMRLVQGEDFELNTPIAHYFMVDVLLGNVTDPSWFPYSEEICKSIDIDVLRLSFMASRGLAKSTVVITFFGVYSAIKGELPNDLGKVYFYLIVTASSKGGARVNAKAVQSMCIESEFLQTVFESMRFTETESEFVRRGKGSAKNRTFLMRYQGINTAIRGIRDNHGRRPCCHVRGTIVTTEYGTYPVEEHPTELKSEGWYEPGKVVKLRGLPTEEVVSVDHSYWAKVCVGNKCVYKKDGTRLARFSSTKPEFTKATALTDRHWIGEAIDMTIVDEIPGIVLTVRDGVNGRDNKTGRLTGGPKYAVEDVVNNHMLDDDFWWMYGLWLGDGTLGSKDNSKNNRGTIAWTVADSERGTVGKKLKMILNKLGLNYAEQSTDSKCYNVRTGSTQLADWLRLHKAGNSIKNMPEWVLQLGLSKQKNILLGYIAADGYIDPASYGQVRVNSVNYNVLKQLQVIASRLGLPSYIRNTKQAGVSTFPGDKEYNVKHQWEIRLKDNCASTLGFDSVKNSGNFHKQVHIEDGMLWRQVKSVEDTDSEVEVIPIECNNSKLEVHTGTVHAYSTEFGVSKNCVLADDSILNTAAAYSKTQQETLNEAIHSDSINALKGGGRARIIMTFTPFSYGDVNTRTVIEKSFTPIVIPIAAHFEKDTEVYDINSSWDAMHPAMSIKSQQRQAIRSNTLNLFLQERMLQLTSSTDRLIPDECIQYCDMKPIRDNLSAYRMIITTDYTTTSGENSDYSGRATFAISSDDDWFMIDLTLRKMGIKEQYRDTLDQADEIKRRGVHVQLGVEIDGNQQAHIYGLEEVMRQRGTYHSFARQKGSPESRKGILSRASGVIKHERFRIVSTRFLQKKVWLPEHLKDTADLRELVEQIKGATHKEFTRSDDGPDLFSQLEMIEYTRPTGRAVVQRRGRVDDFWEDEEAGKPDAGAGYS